MSGVGGQGPVVVDPEALDRFERHFRCDLWGSAVEDAVLEHRIEVRRHGPVQAMAVAGRPVEPRFNLILGAADPRAVADGHLAEASDWLRELGVDHYVPVTPGRPESGAAEDWLSQNGYEPRQRRARFVRNAAPAAFEAPPQIEVDELTDPNVHGEFFSSMMVDCLELDLAFGTFFFDLPGVEGWRCYAAIDEEEVGVACAAMRIEEGVAQFGLDATRRASRGRGFHVALLRRRIADAAASGCEALFTETEEALSEAEAPSPLVRNYLRAGFERASTATVWGPVDPGAQPVEELDKL